MRISLGLICSIAVISPLMGQEPPATALKARAVFEKHCYACHGKEGANEGGMNFVLNRDRLVSSRKIVPNDLKASRALKRMVNDEMPPEEDINGNPLKVKPTKDEIEAVKQWIEAGAPDFTAKTAPRKFISNMDVIDFIYKDLNDAGERQRRFLRYFTITHLYNAGLSEDELVSYRVGLSKLVNSLSWGRDVKVPEPLDPAKTIFRIDLRHYGWKPDTWDRLLAMNPYGVTYKTRKALSCYDMTESPLPYVRGDWFVHAASRPPLYHEILDLPATDMELEKLLHVDVAENIKNEEVARAAFNGSGVSRNNRLVERHKSVHGAYWKSYDFASNTGRQNLFQYPLGPGKKDNLFQHDGGEIIFSLPNGLQGYFLCDGEGKRLDKGPVSIVSDPRQGDRSVVNGISCMTCHNQGMIEKSDQIREHVAKNADGFNQKEVDTIKALYLPKKDFVRLVKEDAERFKKAVVATGAHLSKTEPVFALAGAFEREIDLKMAAAEVGLECDELTKGLRKLPELARVFGPVQVEGGTVQRQVLVSHFAELTREFIPEGTLRLGGSTTIAATEKFHVVELEGLKIEFVRVGKGRFTMGSPANENNRVPDMEEQKEVSIDYDFYIGKFEVTQAQWDALMPKGKNAGRPFGSTPRGKEWLRDVNVAEQRLFPVGFVSWDDTQEYIKELNDREKKRNTGWIYRLPKEAEWEYACRGGHAAQDEGKKTNPFFFAKPINWLTATDANFNGTFPYGDGLKGPFLQRPRKVGSYPANVLGIHDMHGNAAEWTDDLFKNGLTHVFRGGGWTDPGASCRAAKRIQASPGFRRDDLGFRLVRVPLSAK
jgi:formylglycine-generating enzyme required for sulfatase activity